MNGLCDLTYQNASYTCMMRVTRSKKYKVLHDNQLHNSILNDCKFLRVVYFSLICGDLNTLKKLQPKLIPPSPLGMIHRNLQKTPKLLKEQLYQTLIRPQLEYASSAWSRQDIILLRLEKVLLPAIYIHGSYANRAINLNDETLSLQLSSACIWLFLHMHGIILL